MLCFRISSDFSPIEQTILWCDWFHRMMCIIADYINLILEFSHFNVSRLNHNFKHTKSFEHNIDWMLLSFCGLFTTNNSANVMILNICGWNNNSINCHLNVSWLKRCMSLCMRIAYSRYLMNFDSSIFRWDVKVRIRFGGITKSTTFLKKVSHYSIPGIHNPSSKIVSKRHAYSNVSPINSRC